MKIAISFLVLIVSVVCCTLFLGCASTPNSEPINSPKIEGTNSIAIASCETNIIANSLVIDTATNITNVASNNIATVKTEIAPTNVITQAIPHTQQIEKKKPSPTPKDNPKNWDVDLYENCKTAQIDNTEVFLYNPPKKNGNNQLIPHFIDQTKIIDVICNAHNTPIVTNRQLKIFIDPGHGGMDPGAISKNKNVYEKTLALDIAQRLQTYLSGAGFITKLSRTDNNTTISLEERSIMANQWKADLFISIHINSSSSTKPTGIETYILANVGQLSTSMDLSSMTASDWDFVNATYRGNKNDKQNLLLGYAIHRRTIKTTRIPDRGLRMARFNILRNTSMPTVLVECGYISSQKDLNLLNTTDYRERCARGIYQGICDYVTGRMQPGLVATPVPTKGSTPIIVVSTPKTNIVEAVNTTTPTPVVPTTANPIPEIIKEETDEQITSHKGKSDLTPERLIKSMENMPTTPKQPEWTPNYTEETEPAPPELIAIREEALRAAGITFSPKDDNLPKPQQQEQPKD